MENQNIPGKSAATASMVLGIISIVCWFFGWSLIASVILGVVGLILSSNAKKAGFVRRLCTIADRAHRRRCLLDLLHCLCRCGRRRRWSCRHCQLSELIYLAEALPPARRQCFC